MKKIVIFLLVLLLGIGGWWKYSSYVKTIKESVQGDPAKTVDAFMANVVKISDLIWDKEKRENLTKELKGWLESAEKGKKKPKGIPESLKEYGFKQDPRTLFENERLGKAALSAFAISRYKSYSLGKVNIKGNTAEVELKVLVSDVLGLGTIISKLGAPRQKMKKEPTTIPFTLKKQFHRWYITDIGGIEGRLADAIYRMSKYK